MIRLPKWPQMLVSGDAVTIEQAKEIIRRTDVFFQSPKWAGNNRAYGAEIIRKLGIPDTTYEHREEWRKQWGYIPTQYVHNDWMASSFAYGPHGWCHPDGTIRYIDNIGKWPSVGDVREDWDAIAKAFPFLRLTAVLMDREGGEDGGMPLVGYAILDGEVSEFCPRDCEVVKVQRGLNVEVTPQHGVPWEWIEEWAL